MTTWSDSRVVSGTVASTAETQVGSDINVPQNQTYLVTGVYFTHPQGGTGRMAIDSLSGLNGTYIQNSNDPLQLASGEGSASRGCVCDVKLNYCRTLHDEILTISRSGTLPAGEL